MIQLTFPVSTLITFSRWYIDHQYSGKWLFLIEHRANMDQDGPCAGPQGNEITESISKPLLNAGMTLISISLAMAISFYYSSGTFNNRLVLWIMI